MQDPPIFVTFYGKSDWTKPDRAYDTTWAEFCSRLERLGHEVREDKDGPLVSFVKLKPDTARSNANSLAVTGWSLDLDAASTEQVAETLERLRAAGLAFLCYTTYSHDPGRCCAKVKGDEGKKVPCRQTPDAHPACGHPFKESIKFRVMGPLAAAVIASGWKPVWRAITAKFAPWTDESCKDISRGWYTPACPPESTDAAIIWSEDGAALDVGTLDVQAPRGPVVDDLNAPEVVDQGVKLTRAPAGTNPLAHAITLASTMPVAADSEGGGTALFRVARALVWGLSLDPSVAAKIILDTYAPRALVAGYEVTEEKAERRCQSATSEEGAAYVKGALLPPAPDSHKHLPRIVQKGATYWLRASGSADFNREAISADLLTQARACWGESDIEGDTEKAMKEWIRMQAGAVQIRYSCYYQSLTEYDPDKEVLTRGLKMDPELRSMFDPEVEAWLTALAGSKLDALKKWIAASRPDRLRSPARALGVIGEADIGKTMIAHALARVWGRAAVDAHRSIQKHNGIMTECPIVLADECIPEDMTGEAFRNFLSRDTHTIEPKGQEMQQLLGCVRMIVAANNVNKLFLAGAKGAGDVNAIADRLFVIVVPENSEQERACREALKPLQLHPTGRVDLKRMAEHFIWIQNHVEPAFGRFIGAPEDADATRIVRSGETEKNPETFELIRQYFDAHGAWDRQYVFAEWTPKRRGEPCPEQRTNFPILIHEARCYVRVGILAQLLGVPLAEVSRVLAPFRTAEPRRRLTLGGATFDAFEIAPWDLPGVDEESLVETLATDTADRLPRKETAA